MELAAYEVYGYHFQRIKYNLVDVGIVLQIDYAENYSTVIHYEIQAIS